MGGDYKWERALQIGPVFGVMVIVTIWSSHLDYFGLRYDLAQEY